MAEYFTSDHFKYLDNWKGVVYDSTNPEQQRVRKELVKAYDMTKKWAKALQSKMFPGGWTKAVRNPTDQWQKRFLPYNWARIYPTKASPKGLAYTVGIDAEGIFVVKIDLVDINVKDPSLRSKYKLIRGPFSNQSPIVAILSAEDGLKKSFSELVDWSIDSISKFELSYNDVAERLRMTEELPPLELLAHFRGNKDFTERQPNWGHQTTALFCRLAKAVHNANLDWYFTLTTNKQLCFGQKDKGRKGKPIGGLFLQKDGIKLTTLPFNGIPAINDSPISNEIVRKFESLSTSLEPFFEDNFSVSHRPAYWPDDYVDEGAIEDQEAVQERKAFNRILYGPPGTGKTFELLQLLKSDYTDEETPDINRWLIEQVISLGWFQIIALVLLDAGRPLKVANVVSHKFFQAKATANARTKNLTQTAWGYLQRHTWSKSTTVDAAKDKRAEIAIFDKDEQSNWFIVDALQEQVNDLLPILARLSAGPIAGAVIKRYEFITFHQSYGYEEFVEGLRPETGEDASDQVRYEILHGPLRKICARAEADSSQFYALVIDEINRGNISKIFGELITLIEIDKRAGSDFAVPITLPYSGDPFIIPPNVDFIGSMNTADRSLALVDTALRRRFEFVPKLPRPGVLEGLTISVQDLSIDVKKLLTVINDRIEALYDRDHTIGHAYFTHIIKLPPEEQFRALKAAFQNKIIPLLEEYFFEDWQKIRLVLGDNQKINKELQFIEELNREDDLAELFGQDHEVAPHTTRARYRFNAHSLDMPGAYVGIYAPEVVTINLPASE